MKYYAQNGQNYTIDDHNEIHRGGEGRIMLLPNSNMVAKLYFTGVQTLQLGHFKALQNLNSAWFATPNDLLYADKHLTQIAGYTMPYLGNQMQPLAAWFSAAWRQRQGLGLPQVWQLAEQLTQIVAHAHTQGIIIGDLSPYNILVSPKNELKLVDTDSYQSAAHKHTGILYDEIRDYLYNGVVNKESDYFALAVLIFQLLTNVHPFKGQCAQYPALRERMIQKLPIFASNIKITAPKCYVPISFQFLQQQFDDLFLQGHRAPLQFTHPDNINKTFSAITNQTPAIPTLITSGNLLAKTIYQPQKNEVIQKITANQNQLLISTNLAWLVYNVSAQGYARLLHQFERSLGDDLFIGENNILLLRNNLLHLHKENELFKALKNGQITARSRAICCNNLLTVVDDDVFKQIYIDECVGGFVRTEVTPVFGAGFKAAASSGAGWLQLAGGQSYLWYQLGQKLATLPLNGLPCQNAFVCGDVGILALRDLVTTTNAANTPQNIMAATSMRYVFFKANGLQLRLDTNQTNTPQQLKHITHLSHARLLLEPADNALLIRRTDDFALVQQLNCPLISNDTCLFYTSAGIVALEENCCYLLNTNTT